jgi:hypothetical protein
VHDASRLEWVLSLPLNLAEAETSYDLELTIELPHNVYAQHDGWMHIQELSRLESPEALDLWQSGSDSTRHAALGIAHALKRALERLERECLLHNSLLTTVAPGARTLEAFLRLIENTLTQVQTARARFEPAVADPGPIAREKEIADEFVSSRLLDWLARVQHTFDESLYATSSRFGAEFCTLMVPAHQLLRCELESEIDRREQRGYINPVETSPESLARFMERASMLKKHFQEALFLEQTVQRPEHRIRNLVAIVAAIAASVAYFIANNSRALKALSGSMGATILVGALAYAAKDRIKELSRGWLSQQVTRRFGHRVITVSAPSNLVASDCVLETASETFGAEFARVADDLNPSIGQIRRVASLCFRRHALLRVQPRSVRKLRELGFMGVKHVFRYDFSGTFARLDDATKHVPAYDPSTRSARFVPVPRHYRFPVRLRVRTERLVASVNRVLVVTKNGIVRLEDEAPLATPAFMEADSSGVHVTDERPKRRLVLLAPLVQSDRRKARNRG